MNIIDEKYENIAPMLGFLKDEVILAQAWKKSHMYIRRYNWYADILDLDCSIVDLKSTIDEWSKLIVSAAPYKPEPLRVILAPKKQKWYFPKDEKDWRPQETEQEEPELRPLAHLSLRDQTIATAVMLCLADAIESAQGPSEEQDFLRAQREEIYSYGNRLYCNWTNRANKRRQAKFSWGSSKCYRQYFDDYKTFLKRPKDVCKHYASTLAPNEEIFVISLDFSKFYDNIDHNFLIEELKNLYEEYFKNYNLSKEFESDSDFWKKVKEIFSWEWSANDCNEIIKDQKTSLGLPQGLVASGFFANAYLVRFDRLVGEFLKANQKEKLKELDFEVHFEILDYCRYVDDIRLVVKASRGITLEKFKEDIHKFIDHFLSKHFKESKKIEINEKKTSIIAYGQLSTESNISAIMNTIQHRISGTPDADALHQIVGELVGLLRMSDVLIENEITEGNALELSRISLPHMDIRDDTIKRFSAARLVKTLRMKKNMTVHSEKIAVNEVEMKSVTAGQMLDHEFETVARKLIFSWAENPSLSLLLKYGFELYPDVKLLHPVLEALELKLFNYSNVKYYERKTAEYVISDLLKASSISIGYNTEIEHPESVNLKAFREELSSFAKRLMDREKELPWYVKQQAILFLITNGDYGFKIEENEDELRQYRLLHDAILYRLKENRDFKNTLAVSIVAQQLNPNKHKYATWFTDWTNNFDDDSKKQVLEIMLMNRPDLFKEIIQSPRMKNSNWDHLISSHISTSVLEMKDSEFDKLNGEFIPLLRIIQNKNNPFKQENALLLLAKAILEDEYSFNNLNEGMGIAAIHVKCRDWSKVQNPNYNTLEIEWKYQKDGVDNLFKPPNWVETKFKWVYTFGAILRACLIGAYDFTSHIFLYKEDAGIYKGIKSTSYTRKFSIINRGEALEEEPIPITPWLSEFLYKLLQWPGIIHWKSAIHDWEEVTGLSDILFIIKQRINHQRNIYGKLSNTPIYTLPVSRHWKDKSRKLRFAVVQTLIPKVNHFNEKDPTNWNAIYRSQHRDHLASICKLVNKKIKSTVNANRTIYDKENENSFEGVDVIIFPELSVHSDDVRMLQRLSDVTKAHIFAGLTFVQPSYTPKPINQALWLIRNERGSSREFIQLYQGKQHMTQIEKQMKIQSYRPYQIIIELEGNGEEPIRLAGSICYDATDIAIAADLRDLSDIFIISAMNKDIRTFDNMVAYLHYHMYQPVILANTGEFGGSTVQAPFSNNHRTIAHVHGNHQIAISIFDIDPTKFKQKSKPESSRKIKTPPAGFNGR